MSEYDKVIDKYWAEFLIAYKGDCGTEGARHSRFWFWFYRTLCENSRQLVEQKWKEAQGTTNPQEIRNEQ